MQIKILVAVCIIFISAAFPILSQSESDFAVSLNTRGDGVIINRYNPGNFRRTEVVIPATFQGFPVREIGEDAFSFSGTIVTSIVIPEGVTSIGPNAFHNCINLISITLPSTLTYIHPTAFRRCRQLPLAVQAQIRNKGYTGSFFD